MFNFNNNYHSVRFYSYFLDDCISINHFEPNLIDPIVKTTPTYTHLKLRTVHHYGYEFLYGSNTVNPGMPLPGGLPQIINFLLERLMDANWIKHCPDQLTVNEYEPGAGWFQLLGMSLEQVGFNN